MIINEPAIAPDATNVINKAVNASHQAATKQSTPTRFINVPQGYVLLFNPATGQSSATDAYFNVGDSVLGVVLINPNGYEQMLQYNGTQWVLAAYSNRAGVPPNYGRVFKDLPSFRDTAVVTRT